MQAEVQAVNLAVFREDCEVAVIGAGPYGLALAAHLKAAKIETRVFGRPLSFWRDHMPKGMTLISSWRDNHIADPQRRFTLDAFARQHGFERREERLPLERFVAYGEWFQRQTVSDVDIRKVIRVEETGRGFCLVLEDGETVRARRVVVATGLAGHELRPASFTGLPSELISHIGDNARLDRWRGRRVAVIGRGQGACEAAALLHAAGTDVELICRGDIRWIAASGAQAERVGRWRKRKRPSMPSAIGPVALRWFNQFPAIAHHTPGKIRQWINAQSLRPAAADWVKPRLQGVRIHAGRRIEGVRVEGNQVGVALDTGLRVYEHVLLATGYRTDIGRLRMLPRDLQQRIAQIDGSPVLAAGFVSSVPKLHFIGASATQSFGPLMHFIAGAGYAAHGVTAAVLAERAQRQRESLVPVDFLSGADVLRR